MLPIIVGDRLYHEGVFTEHWWGGKRRSVLVARVLEYEMLAKLLAGLVVLGSVGWYGLAWVFPALSRRYDVALAGAGLFYGLVLWVCAGQVTGAIALGQVAILGLLGAMGYQVLQLRVGVAEETVALPQGQRMMALVGAVRSRVKGLNAAPLQLKLTGTTEPQEKKDKQEGGDAAIAPPEEQTTQSAEAKQAPSKAETTEKKPTTPKAAQPQKASQPVTTGKGVYQRKNVRKFERGQGTAPNATGQPAYQRKKVRKFEAENRAQEQKITNTESSKPVEKSVQKPVTKSVAPSAKAKASPKTPQLVALDVNGNFWDMAAIAPELLLISESGAIAQGSILEDPWTTPPMDPKEFTLGAATKIAEETAREIAVESRGESKGRRSAEGKRSPRKPKPAPEETNWSNDADTNWPDDADTNWPDDGDTNWPDESPAQPMPRKSREPRKKRPVPVVKGEVVSRSPRRPIILDAELIQDDD
ncbi:MAG: Ycf66 family protein [Cyanophyceae cyanobacterium]